MSLNYLLMETLKDVLVVSVGGHWAWGATWCATGWWSPDTGGRGAMCCDIMTLSRTSFIPLLSDLINTIIDGTVAPGCCQLKPDSPSYQISLLSNIYKSRSSRRSGDFTCGGGKSWNSEMKQTFLLALSTASAWLCKRICNHNLPLYGLVMGNNASTYTQWVSLAFKNVLNFPRASRMSQVHAWESIIDQNDPSWESASHSTASVSVFLRPHSCCVMIASHHLEASHPTCHHHQPIRDGDGGVLTNQRPALALVLSRLARPADTALDLITLASF